MKTEASSAEQLRRTREARRTANIPQAEGVKGVEVRRGPNRTRRWMRADGVANVGGDYIASRMLRWARET